MKTSGGYRTRFIVRTLLPTLLTIGLFITALFLVLIPQFEEIIYGRKREMIRELTNSAWSILEQWHDRETRGLISRDQAQQSAVNQIKLLRYGKEGKDYFWITDHDPVMIMHPYRPDLNGKSLKEYDDSYGNRMFVEMVAAVENAGEGYVDYTWQWKDDSTRIVPKLSFVKGFTPWKWIVGTGIYIEDVKSEIAALERQTVHMSIGISIIIAILLLYIAWQNLRAENQRQRAEQELHTSREKYRALVETSTEGLIMVMADQEVFCNKALYAMIGYAEGFSGEVPFRDLFISVPHANIFDFETFRPVAGQEAALEQVEAKLRTMSGGVLDVVISISPITLLQKEGIVLSVKDISRHKQIEDALDSSQEQYRTLTNQLSIGVFRTAPTKEARFLEVNPAAGNILGASDKNMLLTYSLLELFDDVHEGRRFFETLFEAGIVRNWITAVRRLTGAKAIISLSAILIRDKQGKPLACDGVLEDITEQKRSETERENLLSDLQISILLLHQPVQPFAESYPSCDMQATIGDAVQLMTRRQRDAILVTTTGLSAIGIVTECDIRERVLAPQVGLDNPVHTVMTSPLLGVPSSSTVFDVLQLFAEKHVSHVVVNRTDGTPAGIVHARDIQHALYTSYLYFLQRIESLSTARELKEYHSRLQFLVQTLIARGAHVADVTRVTTLISQALTHRIIVLAMDDLGEPPVPFAFIALGSDGRKEQTLLTDQDNAIVYQDPSPDLREKSQAYFLRLGEEVCAALDTVGYHFCKGGIMAKNVKWCQPLAVWKTYFTDWVTNASPQDLLDAKTFFDFRLLHGNEEIVQSLQTHVKKVLTGNDPFFLYLSDSVIKWELPDGIQKLKGPFDIKKVIMPIVDGARLHALKHQVAGTNTLDRLALLYEANVFSRRTYQDIAELYSFLMRIRFRHQAKLISENLSPNNEIDPAECTESDLMMLKRGVGQIDSFKAAISLGFKGVAR